MHHCGCIEAVVAAEPDRFEEAIMDILKTYRTLSLKNPVRERTSPCVEFAHSIVILEQRITSTSTATN